MPNPKIIYITGYNVAKNSGRAKATREKAAALKALVVHDRFAFIYPGTSRSRLLAYVKALFFDIVVLRRLFFVDKNARIIQRTTFLPLTNIYLKIRGVRIIYELHTDFKDEIKHYQVSSIEKLVLYAYVFVEKFNLWIADGIIYNHPVLQQLMQNKYRKPSVFTYNGADPRFFLPMDMHQCRKKLGLHDNVTYYLFAGSLAKWRGVDLLIDIFKNNMQEDQKLLIVGNVNHLYGKELVRMASGARNIIFKDEVTVSEIVEWINAADVCLVPVNPVLPSPGNPLKLYDYISCGKPVAGQENVIGCADEIVKYDVGIVTDFFNAPRAASELRVFASQLDAKHFTQHNRKVALTEIAWEKRMSIWLEFLQATF